MTWKYFAIGIWQQKSLSFFCWREHFPLLVLLRLKEAHFESCYIANILLFPLFSKSRKLCSLAATQSTQCINSRYQEPVNLQLLRRKPDIGRMKDGHTQVSSSFFHFFRVYVKMNFNQLSGTFFANFRSVTSQRFYFFVFL